MSFLSLNFGALAPSISEQLAKQGFCASKKDILRWQKDADAITRLCIRGLLPDVPREKALQRLVNNIARGGYFVKGDADAKG